MATLCHLWMPWKHLDPAWLARTLPWDVFGVLLWLVPGREAAPSPAPCLHVPGPWGQGRVACPLNGLQQQQVLGKAKRDGSRCCKGSSSAHTNPALLHPG